MRKPAHRNEHAEPCTRCLEYEAKPRVRNPAQVGQRAEPRTRCEWVAIACSVHRAAQCESVRNPAPGLLCRSAHTWSMCRSLHEYPYTGGYVLGGVVSGFRLQLPLFWVPADAASVIGPMSLAPIPRSLPYIFRIPLPYSHIYLTRVPRPWYN